MLKLYGSMASPFARRLRIWLANTEHEFIDLQIYAGEDREFLAEHNPTMKIPMIEDDGELIYDSRVIYRYLSQKFKDAPLSWEMENVLTLIDSANDSFVQLLIAKRSDIEKDDDKLFFKLHNDHIAETLKHLNKIVTDERFKAWQYLQICLYCLLDWVEFRQLHDLSGLDNLLTFQAQHQDRIEVTATDPRVE